MKKYWIIVLIHTLTARRNAPFHTTGISPLASKSNHAFLAVVAACVLPCVEKHALQTAFVVHNFYCPLVGRTFWNHKNSNLHENTGTCHVGSEAGRKVSQVRGAWEEMLRACLVQSAMSTATQTTASCTECEWRTMSPYMGEEIPPAATQFQRCFLAQLREPHTVYTTQQWPIQDCPDSIYNVHVHAASSVHHSSSLLPRLPN